MPAAMGPAVSVKTAVGTYPYTRPLKDGTVSSPRLRLEHVEVVPVNRAFRPMVNDLAYDASEMALVTLLLARAVERPIVGIPVVMMQQSVYGVLLVRSDSPLRRPEDLQGSTIGVRSYTQTTGTWLRGMLHDQFGLDLDSLSWVTFEPAHVDGFEDPLSARRAPEGVTLSELVRQGKIDAAAGLEPRDHPDLRPLIPDAARAEADWIRQTGIRPIYYQIPNTHIESRGTSHGIRLKHWRGVGHVFNVFAIESMVDQMAVDRGVDPIEFRFERMGLVPKGRKVFETVKALVKVFAPAIEDWVVVRSTKFLVVDPVPPLVICRIPVTSPELRSMADELITPPELE